jgi:hypothetical protein
MVIMLSRAHGTPASCEGLLGVTKGHAVVDGGLMVLLRSLLRYSVLAQHSSRFKTAALTDRLPVAHLASNTHDVGRKRTYALTCQSYSSNGGTVYLSQSANPLLSFARQLMHVLPVVLHISSRCASYQMRDNKCEITGKVEIEIERPAASRSRGEAIFFRVFSRGRQPQPEGDRAG